MKKKDKKIVAVGTIVLVLLIASVGFGIFLLDLSDAFGTYRNRMLDYYQDDTNFYQATGTIKEVAKKDDEGCRLQMENLSYDREVYGWDPCWYVIHYSDADELWKTWAPEEGMTITFTSADCIFYDGYTWPIVAVTYEGETMINFATGKAKLIEWVNK